MSKLAKRYVNAVVSSADAERSFSLYNIILDCRRRSLSEDSLKYICFLYNNECGQQLVPYCSFSRRFSGTTLALGLLT